MNRRRFLQELGLTIPAGAVLPASLRAAAAPPRRLQRVGLELYGVRAAMRRDPERTLAAVRAIGYLDVELLWSFGNFGRSVTQVKAALDAEGLRAPSAHIAPELLAGDWVRALEDARSLGHEMLIVPSLPPDTRASVDRWREWADRFNVAGAAAREAGVWLAFHNEPDHMKPVDGQVPYAVFVERLDPRSVRLQLDVGNMTMGGGDPLAWLARYPDRYWSFHLKDVVADRSRDTGLGQGIVELRRLLGAVGEIDRKPCYVEQEGAADDVDAARADFAYLSRLEF